MNYVSLGGNCAVAYQLDIRKLSYTRYPFDWCNVTIYQLIDTLDSNFKDFEDISIVKKSENHMCFKTNDNYSLVLKNKYNISKKRKIWKRKHGGGLWDADLIIPVKEGGGMCGLENIRTLCIKCHKMETKKLAQKKKKGKE